MNFKTQEFAKNATAEVTVQCSGCKKKYKIAEMLKEQPLPHPNVEVVEGFLQCPTCGVCTHSYFMTEQLRHVQAQLKRAILTWQRDKSNVAWQEYTRRQQVFKNNFDKVQERYQGLLKELESGRGKNNAQLKS